MAKNIFWKAIRLDGNYCTPCPFLGVNVDSYSEFIEKILKDKLFRYDNPSERNVPGATGTYPAVEFSTRIPHVSVKFCGTRFAFKDAPMVTNQKGKIKPTKWCVFDEYDGRTVRWLNLTKKEDQEYLFSLFHDTDEIKRRVDALSAIVERDGGLTFAVR